MARPARPWFRLYVEAFGDRKLRRLTPTQRWIWVAVLGAARESCVPGELFIAPGVPMEDSELAEYAGVKEREIRPALAAMEALGMVDQGVPVTVTNWSDRQYESDDVTKRVRAHRERSKEQDRNVSCNAPDTETDTETESEALTAPTLALVKEPKRTTRGTRVPDPFPITDEMAEWANSECPSLNRRAETQKFLDYWRAQPGQKGVKLDWEATWRNWMRRAASGF